MKNAIVSRPWTPREDALIVSDYLHLLDAQSAGMLINKSSSRRALVLLLDNRSEASVEFKRCNVSAELVKLGQPYLAGYLPRDNSAKGLAAAVAAAVASRRPALLIAS